MRLCQWPAGRRALTREVAVWPDAADGRVPATVPLPEAALADPTAWESCLPRTLRVVARGPRADRGVPAPALLLWPPARRGARSGAGWRPADGSSTWSAAERAPGDRSASAACGGACAPALRW